VPFAVQLVEYFECSDLNSAYQKGDLALVQVAVDSDIAILRSGFLSIVGR